MRPAESRPVAILMLVALVAGCSGFQPYRHASTRNLTVDTRTDEVKATVDIYAVDAECRTDFRGSVRLENGSTSIGLPVNATSYLEFAFSQSSFLSSTTSTVSQGVMIRPRAGQRYRARVTYLDNMYDVTMTRAGKKPLPLQPLSACKPG